MIYEDDLAIGREGFEVLTDKEMTNVIQECTSSLSLC